MNFRNSLLACVTGAALTWSASAAFSQTLSMATDAVGSSFNAIGAGISKVVTEHSPHRVVVRAFAGPDAYLGALQNGEVDLATMSSSTAYVAWEGKNKAKRKYDKLRILRAGEGGVRLTFLVTASSGIKTISDLKGKRVTSNFGGHSVIPMSIAGALATADMSWKDVVPVPVTSSVDGIQALGSGRVDASWTSLGMPASRELHARSGVRYLPVAPGEKSLKALREHIFPGAQLAMTKADPSIGLPEDAHLITYESYLLAKPEMNDKTARAILETLWDRTEQLNKTHPGLRGFSHANAVSDIPMVPYHPAAIAFYKEKGVWTKEAEAANNKLIGK